MKTLIAVALVATSIPAFTTPAAAREGGSARERRYCTQPGTARAGSRMSGRRLCRTAAHWQETLGPDWRQHLSGRYVQDELEALQVRGTPVDEASAGMQGIPITHPGRPSPGDPR